VALRTEIEVLRSKTRNQSAMIARLQALVARAGPAAEAAASHDEAMGENGAHEPSRPAKVVGKRKDQAPALKAVEKEPEAAPLPEPPKPADAATEAEIRRLTSTNRDQAAEISRLKAALTTYESADKDERGIKDSKIALKARLSALQALSDEQGTTIQSLRAEVAAGNERLARQAAYFMEEMRRLGAGTTVPASGPGRKSAGEPAKRPLVERINDPRVARLVRAGGAAGSRGDDAQKGNPRRVSGFLKALDGDSPEATAKPSDGEAPAAAAKAEKPEKKKTAQKEQKDEGAAESKPPRKARLLERITGLDKTSA